MKFFLTALMQILLLALAGLPAIAAEIAARAPADGYTLMMLAIAQAVGSTPREFDRFLRSELARFAKVIKEAGIRIE